MLSRLFLATSLFLCPLIIALENHLGPLDESGLTIEAPLKRPVLGLKLAGLSFPLSGLDADSNAFFVQGISALHAFWNFEAERNFREVIRRNPKHPLPRAFAAFAQKVFSSGDAVRGAEYIRSAHSQLLAGGSVISEVEHLWLEAIQALYDTRLENDKARQAAHISLLRQVLKSAREPGLIRETKAFLALALWNYKIVGAPRDQPEIVILREEADRLIEEVLKEIPCHPVHHYKIHLWNGTHDILARDSAKICGMCNADAQHLWHMPSHIFSNVKEFRNAAYNFEAGLRVDNRHLNTAALPSHVIHNYSHNIDYLMSVSTANGAIDRALIIAKNALAGPRFFQGQEYHDPVDRTAEALVNLLENHFMWKEGIDLYQGGFLSGLLDRKGDGVRKAKLLRFIGLAALETREWNLAHKMIDEIRSVRDIVSKQEGNTAPSLVELEKLETDLRFWRNVRESSETHSIPENTLQELQKLGVTPLHRLALLSEEDGNSMGALASAKEAVQKEGASDVMPRAILAYLLAKNDQKVEALRQWNVMKSLTHIPMKQETGLEVLSIEGAFPFMDVVAKEFETKGIVGNEGELFAVSANGNGRQHTSSTWLKANQVERMADLGPLTLARVAAPIGPDYSMLWKDLKGEKTAGVEDRLAHGTTKEKGLIIIFRQAKGCPLCDAEQKKFVKDWAEKFARIGYEAVFVYPDEPSPLPPDSTRASYVFDPSLKAFRAFGTFDEFDEAPSHSIYLSGSQSQIRWSARTPHAFSAWEGLLNEAKRLSQLE